MFDDYERTLLLLALWNYKRSAAAMASRDGVPPEGIAAMKGELDRIDQIAMKLGGDPGQPAFGLASNQ